MKVLLNFDVNQKAYIPNITFALKTKGHEVAGISKELTKETLVEYANMTGSQAVMVCSEATLRNLVSSPKATLATYKSYCLCVSV